MGLHLAIFLCVANVANAVDSKLVDRLLSDDNDEKIIAINNLVESQDKSAIAILNAMLNGNLNITTQRVPVALSESGEVIDIVHGIEIEVDMTTLQPVGVNNRLRGVLSTALAALRLSAQDHEVRLQAAKELSISAEEEMVGLIRNALKNEKEDDIKLLLEQALANIGIQSADPAARREAVMMLGRSDDPNTKIVLGRLLERQENGGYIEPDPLVRNEAKKAIESINQRLVVPEIIGTVFSGLSLGSVLLLAALGLAITFGLMGIINMAHGELLMFGAYTTYVVQLAFKNYLPGGFQYYLLVAIPAAFLVSALVGVLMERTIIRHLYGRPLETLLATWGISLILIQFVRMVFGAQNVEVANPAWMSGGLAFAGGVVLPYNRMAIIIFALVVSVLVWALLNRTRLGLYVRAVTQNRGMADCMGIATPRIDWMTFGLGSGIAGLGGVALSQIGNVGPDLGQSYIVDSFLVVVLGGVGQMSGTIIAALGLGELNKFLEPHTGAVLGKILILVLIILFIQKRPQGIFALKGRVTEV
ncbi:MAG: urea ABC transporter permease subunit UrtB [Gammaproteobacteria bacterium]|nr:urea ABC transporter permease subunit UrtB [Gammaproteobacteria bacterium]